MTPSVAEALTVIVGAPAMVFLLILSVAGAFAMLGWLSRFNR